MSEAAPEKEPKPQKTFGQRAEDELARVRRITKEGGDPQLIANHLQQATALALLEVAEILRNR